MMDSLSPLTQRFILHFGEMGSRWGINRTVGQMYALLYVLGKPLNADEIAEYLSFSRSNVSMGLKELQAWRLVKLLHKPGDRREYFEPPKDIWDIFKALLEERRRREIEPTLSMLRDALLENPSSEADRIAQERMREMYQLIELSTSWFDDVQRLSPETLASLMKMGSKVKKLLDIREKFRFGGSVKEADSADQMSAQIYTDVCADDAHDAQDADDDNDPVAAGQAAKQRLDDLNKPDHR